MVVARRAPWREISTAQTSRAKPQSPPHACRLTPRPAPLPALEPPPARARRPPGCTAKQSMSFPASLRRRCSSWLHMICMACRV
jgi:hypothetical protein